MDSHQKQTHLSHPETIASEYRQGLLSLYEISQIIAAANPPRQMVAEVLDVLHNDLGMNTGSVALLSSDGKELIVDYGQESSQAHSRKGPFGPGQEITGPVVQSGRPAIVLNHSPEPVFLDDLDARQPIQKDEIRFLCAPIAIGRETIGIVSVDRVFDASMPLEEDVRVLTIVASMIAGEAKLRRDAAIRQQALEAENLRLRHELADKFRPENIIGNSGRMREVYASIHKVAASDTTVLIRGETGTGKELVAHAIHYASHRAAGPFIKVNCAALSESLLESELFGHEKGAFTGAVQARKGRLEEADGGTLFLDEIGDFSAHTQVRLLRVLQDRQFERVGSNETLQANVRIIAATNRDLEAAVQDGGFRQDLYYRVNVYPIFLPPLRDRKDDILQLADYFVERYARRMNKEIRRISTPAINMMTAYHWPGNVRELENCIERGVLLSTDGVIHSHHLPPTLQTSDASGTAGTGTLAQRVALFERDILVDALKRSNGNMAEAARDLGTTARIIRYKVKKLGIDHQRLSRIC